MLTLSQDHWVYAVMRDGVVVVGVINTLVGGGAGHVTQMGNEEVALRKWHYLLIELRYKLKTASS